MRDVLLLSSLSLRDLFGLNRYRHTQNPKEKKRARLLGCVFALLIVLVCGYVAGLVYALSMLGMSGIVPAYLIFFASVLIVAFGLFHAGVAIFGARGYDLLAAMPLRPRAIVLGRFLSLYVEDLLLSLVILLPGAVTWGLIARPGAAALLLLLCGTLLIPAIPLVISTLFGTVIMALSVRARHRSLIQTVLTVAVLIAVLLGSMFLGSSAEALTPEALTRLAATVSELITTIYPPAIWLGRAATDGNVVMLALFCTVSIAAVVAAIAIVSVCFSGVMRRLAATSARHNYKLGELHGRGLLKTLYLREVRRYFSSSIYVTNTIVGPIMAMIASVALSVIGADALAGLLPPDLDLLGALPFAIGGIMTMMTVTACSLSMEGRQFWIVRSLPLSARVLFDSKLLLNLTLIAPAYLVSEVLLILTIRPRLLDLLWLIVIPAVIILFALVFGITVDLKFHRFDWEREEAVVKQGASSAIGGFAGPLVSLVFGALTLITPAPYTDLARSAATVGLLFLTAVLYRRNGRAELQKL